LSAGGAGARVASKGNCDKEGFGNSAGAQGNSTMSDIGLSSADSTGTRMAITSAERVSDAWRADKPGSEIVFPATGLQLFRRANSAGRDPYLLIKVDRRLIPNHSDICDPRMIDFVGNLIFVSSQESTPAKAPTYSP
jgi:hypothetical protein